MQGCGICISGPDFCYKIIYNTHNIDTTNLVNGKPVCYLKNQTGGTVPAGAGQIIIANCSNITVNKQMIVDCTVGIQVAYSNNCTISNNSCRRNGGIILHFSNASTLINNTCSGNHNGILLISSNTNTLMNNNCSVNSEDGIYLYYSNNNKLANNTCCWNKNDGINLTCSDTNMLTNNNCTGNSDGIYLNISDINTITENKLEGNTEYGVDITYYSTNNLVHHNWFIDNNAGGKQAYDNSGTNFWNTSGTPHGYGNNWSDWRGPDANNDGIVDKPYILDGGMGANDSYPLTIPGTMVPEPSPASLVMIGIILLVAIVLRIRKR